MVDTERISDVTIFLTIYLVLSVIPFLLLNRAVLQDIRFWVTGDVVTIAIVGTGVLVVISALFLANEGVERYNHFLFTPTDLLSVIVELAFVFAAASWWLLPELSERFDWALGLDELVVAVLVCHVPMILFLSLLTAIGKA